MTDPIRVLVVDDSAFARKVVREMLATSPRLQVVGAARDGSEALDLVEQLRPDVITCDLKMPRLDGVEFIRRQMQRRALPILILSSAPQDAAEVIEALHAGAIEIVQKPTALASDDLRGIGDDLVRKVLLAAGASAGVLERQLVARVPAIPAVAPTPKAGRRSDVDIVVIGISTGGPQALRQVLPLIPRDFPVPIAVVLHMPVGYTALYAQKLNEACAAEVREAAEGDRLGAGLILIAPAGRHLTFRRDADGSVIVHLTVQPVAKLHRPSADVLFQSAVDVFGSRVLAIVMTGMGDDGREGAAWVKARGGIVLTEDEKSCVIYGMPRSVVEAGLSDASVLLEDMAQAIATRV
jgi:two-component system chemotaxis response regulator CheB